MRNGIPQLVDRHGRPLRRPKKLANLVIYRSETGEAPWEPVGRDDVPADIKAPDVMGRMVGGEMVKLDSDRFWYVAAKAAEPDAQGLH